ncbi:MAG: DinB family protein [Chloroflexia bacterium]
MAPDNANATPFARAMQMLAGLSDPLLTKPWEWPGHTGETLPVREALYRSLEEEQASAVSAPASAAEAARILALASQAWGDLCGLLISTPDRLLHVQPAPGEWSLAETLAHLLLGERNYAEQTAYAAHRSDSEPLRKELHTDLSEEDRAGGTLAWIERLEAAHTRSYALATLPDEALDRPTIWVGYQVTIRFRLHRFASHVAEHTIQAEKILTTIAPPPTEAARIVRRIYQTRGLHQHLSSPQALQTLDAIHLDLATTLAARSQDRT